MKKVKCLWALAFVWMAASCAASAPAGEVKPSAGDTRAYHLPLRTLELVGVDLSAFEGKTIHLRVVDTVTGEVRRDSASVSGGAFAVTWTEFYKPDRVGYTVEWFADLDGDGRCGQGQEPMWRALAQKDAEADDQAAIRVELSSQAARADWCEAFHADEQE